MERFRRLVAEALDDLPEDLSAHMANVEVVVEEFPDRETAEETGTGNLLGLYQGIPLPERGENYYGVLPDRIVLYRRNIEEISASAEELKEAVRTTVIHEVAHHFGIDDDRLEELGWA